jgi:hypothetical protein
MRAVERGWPALGARPESPPLALASSKAGAGTRERPVGRWLNPT